MTEIIQSHFWAYWWLCFFALAIVAYAIARISTVLISRGLANAVANGAKIKGDLPT